MIKVSNYTNYKALEIDGHERNLATGYLYVAPCSPGGKEGDRINLQYNAASISGNVSTTFPNDCPDGRYVVYSDENGKITKVGYVYVGNKPTVSVSLSPYKKYRNKNLYEMKVNFNNISVVPGRDFGVCVDGRELSIPSNAVDAASKYSFLVSPEETVSVIPKNDIEEYVNISKEPIRK